MCIGASQVGVGGSLLSPQPAQSRWFFSRQRTHDAKAGSSKEAACFSKTWCSCKGDVLQSTHVALLSSTEARDGMRVLFSGLQGLPFQPSNKSEAGNGISWEVWVQKRFVWNVTFYLALLGGWGVSRPLGSTAGPSPSACLSPSHVPLHGFQQRQKPHIKILDPRVPGCFLASGALWTFLLLRHISCVCVCVCVCETEKQTDRQNNSRGRACSSQCDLIQFHSVQSLSHVRLFATPWTAAHQASLSITQLPEFTQTHVHWVGDAIQPSRPLSSPPPPAPNPSQHQSLFKWVNSSHQVAKVLEFQPQHQSFQWTPRTCLL